MDSGFFLLLTLLHRKVSVRYASHSTHKLLPVWAHHDFTGTTCKCDIHVGLSNRCMCSNKVRVVLQCQDQVSLVAPELETQM